MAKSEVKDFISDEEMSKIESPDFISDEEMMTLDSSQKPLGPVETFAATLGEELSLGYGPNILAGLKAGSVSSPEYISERDKLNELLDLSEAENPKAALGGKAAGIVGGMALPLGVAAKGAGLLSRIGRGAAMGSVAGAAVDTPDIEGEITTPKKELEQRSTQAAIGGAIGAVLPVAGELVPSSVERGFSALGPLKTDVKKVLKAEKSGGKMTRENIVKFAKEQGIMKFGDNVEEMYSKTLSKIDESKPLFKEIYNSAKAATENQLHGGIKKSLDLRMKLPTLESIKNDAVNAIDDRMPYSKDKALYQAEVQDYFDKMQAMLARQQRDLDITDLHEIKKQLAKYAKFSKNAAKSGAEKPDAEEAFAVAERAVNDGIFQSLEAVSEVNPNLAKQLKQLNSDYSYLKNIEGILESRVAGDLSVSRFFGIPEMINEALQPRVNTGLSSIGAGIEAAGKYIPSPLQQPNLPIAAPMMMQQRTESPMQRYKSGQ